MDLKKLFKIKYDLLQSLEEEVKRLPFQSIEEREAFKKGFEKATQAFFMENMEDILDQDQKKKVS